MDHEQIAELKLKLRISDAEVIRIIDDLVEILVAKHVLRMADFPEQTRAQLQLRHDLRDRIQELLSEGSSSEETTT